MDNLLIARYLLEMARGIEYLDENSFRAQAYRRAAQSILELPAPVSELVQRGGISQVPGVGKGIASTLQAWVKEGDFSALEELRSRLPRGLDELLKVPGLGLKRIGTLHSRLNVQTVDDLLEAVKQGRLAGLRSFPRTFVEHLPQSLERVMSYRGKYLLSAGLNRAGEVLSQLASRGLKAQVTGGCRRYSEIIERVEILVEGHGGEGGRALNALDEPGGVHRGDTLVIPGSSGTPPVDLRLISREHWPVGLLLTTGSGAHLDALRGYASEMGVEIGEREIIRRGARVKISGEDEIYGLLDLQYLPPELREGRETELNRSRMRTVPALLNQEDIRGTIHNHTSESDGLSALPVMVLGALERGYQWIGVSDHSRSARYAGGLDDNAVQRQHREIDALGKTLQDITVFKGIESDILADGSLDYPPEVLEAFDFVIASVHSHMDMDEKTMTRRIIKALRNPFTTILAHPTGRLLLSREPYEVDMDTVLDEALRNGVAVELNANPMRLDLDWRLMDSFVSQGGILAIGPDAHSAGGLDDMAYGVMIARKGFATPQSCLNTLDVRDVREWFRKP